MAENTHPSEKNTEDEEHVELKHLSRSSHFVNSFNVDKTNIRSVKKVTYVYLFGLATSLSLHVLDVGTDIYLAYQYYVFKQNAYFVLTLLFVAVPAIINTLISIRMYVAEQDTVSKTRWFFRCLLLCLQLSPVIRYIEALHYAIKLKKKDESQEYEKYYKPLLVEDSNLALLRIVECFLEAAPQQVLQLSILLQLEPQNINHLLQIYQYMTISTSLLSIAWSFAVYNRSVRFARDDKKKMNWNGSLAQLCWLFSVTSARILSISEAASVYPKSTFFVCMIHWFCMTCWLTIVERTWFCYSTSNDTTSKIKRVLEILFCCVLGLVYIFTYLTFQDGPTRYRYIFYYSLCFIENTVAVLLWSISRHSILAYYWWFIPLLIVTIGLFLIGIVFMLTYYLYYHPEVALKKSRRDGANAKSLRNDLNQESKNNMPES